MQAAKWAGAGVAVLAAGAHDLCYHDLLLHRKASLVRAAQLGPKHACVHRLRGLQMPTVQG